MGRHRNKGEEKKTAEERIKELFEQADEIYSEEPSLADRYIEKARELSMHYKVNIPSDLQKKFCKHCYSYLRPGSNCRVRTRNDKVVYTCFECNRHMRFPLKKDS